MSSEEIAEKHVAASLVASDMTGMERVVAASPGEGVVVSEFVPGSHLKNMSADSIRAITEAQIDALLGNRIEGSRRGIKFDAIGDNLFYDPKSGFTDIDYELGGKEMDMFKAMCSVFQSINLISEIELEDDPEQKARLQESNLAVYETIGTYCKRKFSDELRSRLADQFQVIRANAIVHGRQTKLKRDKLRV